MLAWREEPPKHRNFEKWDDEGPILGYIGCGVIFLVVLAFVLVVWASYTLATRGG